MLYKSSQRWAINRNFVFIEHVKETLTVNNVFMYSKPSGDQISENRFNQK